MQSNDQWHYTDRTGAQAGPVTKAELQTLISQGIAPQSGMAWTAGMENWQIISQIEALQPAPTIAPPAPASAAVATPANPYTPPSAEPNLPQQPDRHEPHPYGGIGRLSYFVRNLFLIGGLVVVMMVGFASGTNPSPLILIVAMLVFLVLYVRFAVLRIRNIGASGWWLLLMLVPLVNNLLGIALVAFPEGFAQHKKLDTTGTVLVVIFGGLFVLSLAMNMLSLFA